jgi:hypothetical protein
MGQYAGATISQNLFLGFMSTSDNWSWFVNNVLPDVLNGSATVIGGDPNHPGAAASAQSVLMAVQGTGSSNYALTVPTAVLAAATQPATPAAPVATPPPPSQSAKDVVKQELDQWGLSGLTDMAWNLITNGASSEEVVAQIRNTDEYQNRFAGNAYRASRGLPPLSESNYLAYEAQARQVLTTAGFPKGFYDTPDDFANLIGNDVSPQELNDRANEGHYLQTQAPPEVKAALKQFYGIGDADIAAYLLDPGRAITAIQSQVGAATAAGTAQRAGYGNTLSKMQAEQIGQMGLSPAQLQAGFSDLASKNFLLQGFSGEENITGDQALSAEFAGNADAQAAMTRRQKARLSGFTGGGQFAASQKGVAGLGAGQTTAS